MTPKYFIYYNKNKKCNLALLLNNECDSHLLKVEDHGLFEDRPLTYKQTITKLVINKTLHFNFV